ncbi:PREDICTED: methyltransferase-like protein 6 [Amphimedon queenslandica]|uniref:tRNA N(3)-methylcytidine methyltransferase n=1 Tax=Amphimedon queenslandica TaxID=400682 RepID=A0A1X7VTK3_AMPQE|nr:PREDICTED: methyltransferase-like protein 6 [Amphimedon queenslandica]|eukprot:XP_003382702.1 PREDICTED: methyltransferase-like protein 6 [Amphimedon queenslandica]
MSSSAGGRVLTEEEAERLLERDKDCISDFKRNKLEMDAKKNWDLFYKRNSTHFFKDRHWITRECPQLQSILHEVDKPVLLEVGCGVGNAVLPLLEEHGQDMFVYACDFSPRAIEYLKSDPLFDESKNCRGFVCDVTKDPLTHNVPPNSVDIALLIFVLSAISPEKVKSVLTNISTVLKIDGGLVFFRDYGLYDHAMLRFSKGHKISENFYMRQDGTRAYYFSESEVSDLFSSAGFDVIENSYVERETVNHKEGVSARRIFVQGKYKVSSKPKQGISH